MSVKLAFVASCTLLFCISAQASVVVNVQGNLLPPACRVDNGTNGDIQVDFGEDININRLNGNSYRQNVYYEIDCGSGGQQWPLRLRFEGIPNGWDNQSLATSEPNLGIRLILGGTVVNFGTNYAVQDSNSPPVLIAVPVSNSAEAPQEGQFTATASLLAEYY